MSDIWDMAGGILADVAPVLGTALGGPFGGMAARKITQLITGKESDNPDDAYAAIQAATPDQLIALKKAEQEFAAQMKELEIDLEKVHATDRNSARQRQMQTKDKMPGYIASAALFGFFTILGAMIFVELPPASEAPLNVMLGALGALVMQIGNYYFGSSASSSRKNEIMNAMLNGGNGGAANG